MTPSEEEIATNHSLEQRLLSDFNIELPSFSEESNLNAYFQDVSFAVKQMGWTVSTEVTQLSLFSFLKINIYRDLDKNAEIICGHSIIRALNGESFDSGDKMSCITRYDHDSVEPKDVFSVVDSDSSQQDAILLAKRGASFVLQGPPGTGKSQTITNIIAELLADGKKVLFVSEKVAALEVVYKRLSQVGLADFCLTLHSHNAKRREILDQFEKSIKMSRTKVQLQQDAFSTLYRLKETRAALNRYNSELHTIVPPLDKTIFQINGYLAQLENYPNIDFALPAADTFTPETLTKCEVALEDLTRVVERSGYQQDNPWNECTLSQITHEFRQLFTVDADKIVSLINEGERILSETNKILGTNHDWAFSHIDYIDKLYTYAQTSPGLPSAWLSLELPIIISSLDKCIRAIELQGECRSLDSVIISLQQSLEAERQKQSQIVNQWRKAYTELLSNTDANILLIDASTYLSLYRENYRTFLRIFVPGYRKAHKMLLSYHRTAYKLTYADEIMLLNKTVTVQQLKSGVDRQSNTVTNAERMLANAQASFDACEAELLSLNFEDICNNTGAMLGIEMSADTSFADLKGKLLWAEQFKAYIKFFSLGQFYVDNVCMTDSVLFDRSKGNIEELREWSVRYKPNLDKIAHLFSEKREPSFYTLPLSAIQREIALCKANYASLEYLLDYRAAERKMDELGIQSYLDKIKELNIAAVEIIPVFKKCFFRSWLDAVMPKFNAINEFRSLRQDEKIKVFRELDKTHLEVSKAMLISRLISHLPNFDAYSSNGEMALLRREMAKQRKLMPTRLLIAALPNLLPVLKPCLMMSPLSVSTFLGSSNYEFDAVIFDEASQIRTEDAIGTIFRAKQTIIAGDSKQLPPTNFFSSYMSALDEFEEDEYSEFNDTGAYESLLDEATLLPTQTLLWHYRSRHEHLIAFSNAKIYKGNLITFPSSVEKNDGLGVEYIHVSGGVYDRGGRNGNRAEADKVAELTFKHFREYPKRSLGIIAFGEVQQSTIQDALIARRRSNPEFELFFKDNNEESLFIKNLETVQGDERDTIIFSIGYAPDSTGKFIMNFGPLNRDGGERRLNVAVTRARYNLKLVGSIMPTDIDVERINAQGPKLLRLYIDFAINGPNAILGEITASENMIFDSGFEISVYQFLTDNGYDVATQVGCSGYRIDLAVRHPRYNGRFAIGVECDGAMYHSARTARERDRLRQTILEDMGWVIYRVWSTDWIKDRNTEGERLLTAVQEAINNYREFIPVQNHESVKMTDFVNVSTQTAIERMREGMTEKYRTLRSRYYGYNAREVPTSDIGAIMLKVIAMNFGLYKVDLFKETAFYGYGWERQGNVIKRQFEQAFGSLICKKQVEIDSDSKIRLIE
jgi:superfamily I DNA and/or RNA helicase/very-short-patch-repair endonuclease